MRIEVARTVPASPARVWAALERIDEHVRWMADAREIRFTSERQRGVGTTFTCLTKVGPLSTLDRMRVTEWEEGRAMGVTHEGLVTGVGRFTLTEVPGGTRLAWSEELHLPWWFAGRLGEVVARPLLRRLWAGNLSRLANIVTGP